MWSSSLAQRHTHPEAFPLYHICFLRQTLQVVFIVYKQQWGVLLLRFLLSKPSLVPQLCLIFHRVLISRFGRASVLLGSHNQNKLSNVFCLIFPRSIEIRTDVHPLMNQANHSWRPLEKDCCSTAGFWQVENNPALSPKEQWTFFFESCCAPAEKFQ